MNAEPGDCWGYDSPDGETIRVWLGQRSRGLEVWWWRYESPFSRPRGDWTPNYQLAAEEAKLCLTGKFSFRKRMRDIRLVKLPDKETLYVETTHERDG